MAKKKVSCLKKLPEAPASLMTAGAEHWKKIGSVLIASGNLYEIDLPILELICSTWESIRTEENPIGYVKLYSSLMEKFGATPKARLNMKTDLGSDAPSKEDEELMDAFKNR